MVYPVSFDKLPLYYALGPSVFQGLHNTSKCAAFENYYLRTVHLERTLEGADSTLHFTKIKANVQRGQEIHPKHPTIWWQSWDQSPGFPARSDRAGFTSLCCFSLKSSHRITASLHKCPSPHQEPPTSHSGKESSMYQLWLTAIGICLNTSGGQEAHYLAKQPIPSLFVSSGWTFFYFTGSINPANS